jgi:hypothetical protein
MKYSIKLHIFGWAIDFRTSISKCNARTSGDVNTSVDTILHAKCVDVERCCASTTREKVPLPNVAPSAYVDEKSLFLPGECIRKFRKRSTLDLPPLFIRECVDCLMGELVVEGVGLMNCLLDKHTFGVETGGIVKEVKVVDVPVVEAAETAAVLVL